MGDAFFFNLQYKTAVNGLSVVQLSLLTTDQNIVHLISFIITVVRGREGDWTMNQSKLFQSTGCWQNLFQTTQILFGTTQLYIEPSIF